VGGEGSTEWSNEETFTPSTTDDSVDVKSVGLSTIDSDVESRGPLSVGTTGLGLTSETSCIPTGADDPVDVESVGISTIDSDVGSIPTDKASSREGSSAGSTTGLGRNPGRQLVADDSVDVESVGISTIDSDVESISSPERVLRRESRPSEIKSQI
jgi:hypothetical protein